LQAAATFRDGLLFPPERIQDAMDPEKSNAFFCDEFVTFEKGGQIEGALVVMWGAADHGAS